MCYQGISSSSMERYSRYTANVVSFVRVVQYILFIFKLIARSNHFSQKKVQFRGYSYLTAFYSDTEMTILDLAIHFTEHPVYSHNTENHYSS